MVKRARGMGAYLIIGLKMNVRIRDNGLVCDVGCCDFSSHLLTLDESEREVGRRRTACDGWGCRDE